MSESNVTYLAGGPIGQVRPLPPYDERVCAFLSALSAKLRNDRAAVKWPDVQSFAFFCRKANLARLKAAFEDGRTRVGRGLAFHIVPSNVPVNCLFTYAFGLLAGNANIVRASSKDFAQVRLVCGHMQALFDSGEYETVRTMTAIVMYGHDSAINDMFSARANARIIWGGNATIAELRKSPISPRCVELTFADRYSLGVIDPQAVLRCDERGLDRLAEQFYNDTYLMDQNACSAPHLLIWRTDDAAAAREGQKRFWNAVYAHAKKYDLADIKVSDKYVSLCRYAIELEPFAQVERYENLLYVITLDALPQDITSLRGKFGLFFQYTTADLGVLADRITQTVQTCAYYGVEPDELRRFVAENGLLGIDRVVPFGSCLDIGPYWDGYNIVGTLSRIVN